MYALRPPRFDQLMRHAAIGTRNAYLEHARKSLGPMEDWHVVGEDEPFDPDWRSFTGLYVVQFRKDNEGFVYLVGRAHWFRNRPNLRSRNWSYTFGPIFTLPPGYRPQYRAYIGTQCRWRAFSYSYTYPSGVEYQDQVSVNVAGDFVVEPDGRVRPIFVNTGSDGSILTVRFESLAFRAADPVI
ncbi:MAG: hypothetical protein M3545_17115 [Acidobacteriota bacterium]|nr:hypothetical protein [Acidobacteriota bacterium]